MWIHFIKNLDRFEKILDKLLSSIDLANRNLFLKVYSKERVLSTEARKQYVAPDLPENGVFTEGSFGAEI